MKILTATILTLLVAMPAAATVFCGCNGNVELSFTPAPELTPVLSQAPDENGLTIVTVYAVLDDVVEVEGPGGVFLYLGGFEMELRITGAETIAVEKSVLIPNRDFASRTTQCWVGTHPGEKIVGAPLALVSWKVIFTGEVADVRFDLDPAGLLSCERTPDCTGCEASALYVGSLDAQQEGYLFGAGSVPAVLNPSGKPDLAPSGCSKSFAEVGVYKARNTD